VIPVAAFAHPGGHFGFAAGLLHPLGGMDHVLAMVAVGLWASISGGRATWAMPLAFIAAMVVGGIMGAKAVPFPAVEPMILASVILLGIAAALALQPPLVLALAGVSLFAMAHGYAHGAEAAGGLATFGAGFVLATSGLHLVGFGLGFGLIQLDRRPVARALGLAVATAGVAMAIST
jgi:urease accessory protein